MRRINSNITISRIHQDRFQDTTHCVIVHHLGGIHLRSCPSLLAPLWDAARDSNNAVRHFIHCLLHLVHRRRHDDVGNGKVRVTTKEGAAVRTASRGICDGKRQELWSSLEKNQYRFEIPSKKALIPTWLYIKGRCHAGLKLKSNASILTVGDHGWRSNSLAQRFQSVARHFDDCVQVAVVEMVQKLHRRLFDVLAHLPSLFLRQRVRREGAGGCAILIVTSCAARPLWRRWTVPLFAV